MKNPNAIKSELQTLNVFNVCSADFPSFLVLLAAEMRLTCCWEEIQLLIAFFTPSVSINWYNSTKISETALISSWYYTVFRFGTLNAGQLGFLQLNENPPPKFFCDALKSARSARHYVGIISWADGKLPVETFGAGLQASGLVYGQFLKSGTYIIFAAREKGEIWKGMFLELLWMLKPGGRVPTTGYSSWSQQ